MVYIVDPKGKKKAKLLASAKGGDSPFYDMCFSTKSEGTFACIGKRPKYFTY